MVSATYDITRDPNYPYHPFPPAHDAAPPGALQLYNAVYAPIDSSDVGVGGEGVHGPMDPTPDNPGTTQSLGEMARDTWDVGRSIVGSPNWGTAIGMGLGALTGVPTLGTLGSLGYNTLDISRAAREVDPTHIGSGIPSQQLGGALAQAAAAGRYGQSAPLDENSWLGMFGPSDVVGAAQAAKDAAIATGDWGGPAQDKSGDVPGSGQVSGTSGWGGDKSGGPAPGGDQGKADTGLYASGGRVGALARARRG
jgi:hypothetical protein